MAHFIHYFDSFEYSILKENVIKVFKIIKCVDWVQIVLQLLAQATATTLSNPWHLPAEVE